MAEGLDTIKEFMPTWDLGIGAMSIVAWLIIAIVFLALVGVGTYFIVRRWKFNKKIVIFEKINGRFQNTKKDQAMEMKHGDAGDMIFYLRKLKKKIPRGVLQTGRNTYWYFIREDGELINFEPGDFDADAKTMGARMLDKEMRYARTQLQRSFKDRYDEPGFWKQYGLFVVSIVYIVIVGMMIWLLFDKWLDTASIINGAVQTQVEVLKETKNIIAALDNLRSGGSGLVSAA